MKKILSLLAVLACTALAFGAFADPPVIPEAPAIEALPQAPLFEAIVEYQGLFMTQTCAVIRPVAQHSDCNFFLCEQNGCGAPYHFDPVDCACYCSYMF